MKNNLSIIFINFYNSVNHTCYHPFQLYPFCNICLCFTKIALLHKTHIEVFQVNLYTYCVGRPSII